MRQRSPQRPAHSHMTPQPRQSRSPPPLHHLGRMASRPRSRLPPAKRPRTDEPNGVISLGPLSDSAEPPQKHFEIHLWTAIPAFRLDAPCTAEKDASYPGYLRVTVTSQTVARSLIDVWRRNTVAGYTNIKMVETTAATGRQHAGNGFNTQTRDGHKQRENRFGRSASTGNPGGQYSESSRR
ncbi:hypothetical protein C8J57DRAFT_1581277 [Mycena rebaudengoi]|nr:hypothetical protein C8J57DRAFT_1581277 [Mycena rebaudengoi]